MKLAFPCAALLALILGGCGRGEPDKVQLELFVVAPAPAGAIQYVKRSAPLTRQGGNPDQVARSLLDGIADPAILHSTSWRWEQDGTIVLTYLAWCESAEFRGLGPTLLKPADLAPPAPTDPQHPRPAVIREQDVLAHGIRHFSFLLRYARDGRLAETLSPRSLAFFQSMCGQLAGRLDDAQQFEECAAVAAPRP